jgi:glyoxylase-like metal-dependent hydrolase (beta-lactamase superfamily II)
MKTGHKDGMLSVSVYSFFVGFLTVIVRVLSSHFSGFKDDFFTNVLLKLLSFLRIYERKIPKGLPHVEIIENASERCFRILGLNPGNHTLHGTNTYLVGEGEVKILIDSGESSTAKEWVEMMLSQVFLGTGTKRLSHILLTHGHFDHTGGVTLLLKEMEIRGMLPLPEIFKRRITPLGTDPAVITVPESGDFPIYGFECHHIKDGQEFVVQNDNDGKTSTLRSMYTPGHSDDSVCFALLEDFALFSGDSVLGCGTSIFDDLSKYMQSLEKMRNLMICCDCTDKNSKKSSSIALHTIYPGHGPVVRNSGLEKIDDYLNHRGQREETIMQVFADNRGQRYFTSWELVDLVYVSPRLNFVIKLAAQGNLNHHLLKLKSEGRVRCQFPDLWAICSE